MTRHHHALAVTVLLTLPAVAVAQSAAVQDAATVLNAVAKAMHLEQVKTIRYTATGSAYAIGQSFTAGGPYPRSSMKFVRDFDLDGFSARQEFVNTRVDKRGGGAPSRVGAEVMQVQYPNRNAAWPQHVFLWLNPAGFVKEAPKHNPTLSMERVGGTRYRVITVTVNDRYTVRGYVNDANLIDHVDTHLDNNPAVGDPPLDGVFTGYRDFGGVIFPSRIVHHLAEQPSFAFDITSVTPNVEVNTTPPAADGARGGGRGGAGRGAGAAGAPQVTNQAIARGVYYLTGAALHSVAVEFADHIVVIDAPVSEARSLAVVGEVRTLVPNKPITYLISTHHHFDHAAGLRAYAAEGATIVTTPRNAAFFQKWWSKPAVLTKDKLAESGRSARFETVSDRKVMSDATQTLEIYVVTGTDHVDGMLMVYVPAEKLLIESDLFTASAPGGAAGENQAADNALPAQLLANIKRLKLDVERIVPLQGPATASRADLERAAGSGGAAQ